MGFKKSYTDENNNMVISNAYHRVKINHFSSENVSFVIEIYNSKQDRIDGKVPIKTLNTMSGFPIGNDFIIKSGDDNFSTYFVTNVLNVQDKNLLKSCYQYLKDKIDYYSNAEEE
ncbi:MAG: hypothetical protein KAX49_13705 [Halanaerobiales bacterium]|nr:hypothetical protein [Halanaerobiales bacterium]